MRFSRNLLIFTLLLTFLLGIFLLPRFTISLGGSEVSWPAIDFSLIGVDSPFANFRRGSEIYEGVVITAEARFTESQQDSAEQLFREDLSVIGRRIQRSGMSDVELHTVIEGDTRRIQFVYPRYYEHYNLERLTSFLLSPGTFQVLEHDNEAGENAQENVVISEFFPGYVSKASSIRPEDIQSISIVTDARFGGNLLRVNFSQNAVNDIADAVARVDTTGDIRPPILSIDNIPQFTLLDIGEDLAMVSSPLDPSTDRLQMQVISQYPTEEVGPRVSYGNLEITNGSTIYASEGRKLLAVTFVIGAVFMGLWSLRKFELIGGFTFLTSLATYSFYGLAIMKFGSLPISIGIILGFSMMYALGAVVIYDLMSSGKSQLETKLKRYRDLGAMLFIVAGVAYSSGMTFGVFSELIAAIAFMAIGLFLSSVFGFKQILLNFYRRK